MMKVIEVQNKNSVWHMFSDEIIQHLLFGNILLYLTIYLPEVLTFSWANFIFFQIGFSLSIFRHPMTDRKLYRIDFDEQNRVITCHYYFPCKKRLFIPYDSLSYELAMEKVSVFDKKIKTLFFFKKKKLQLMLPKKNRIGWTKEEIDHIVEELDKVIATRDEKHEG